MNFLEFLQRLNYIMELISLMSFYDAPDISGFGGEEEDEETTGSVTNNCFFQNESQWVYNKWDSNSSLEDFVNRSEKSVSFLETNRDLPITDLQITDTQNLWKSLLYGDNALKAVYGINNYSPALSLDAGGENSLLESFCKKEGDTRNEIYFGESIWKDGMLANAALYNNELKSRERENKMSERAVYNSDVIAALAHEGEVRNTFAYESRERADSFGEAFNFRMAESFAEERERENADYGLFVYHKSDSKIAEGENIAGECAKRAEEYNIRINQMYGLWDSVASENGTSTIESFAEKEAGESKWYSRARELAEKEREGLQVSSGRDIKTYLRESLHRENRSGKGNVNVNVDFKAYAEVKNDYDTEKFAQVFARYLESQLESCAEGLHY